MRPTFLYHSFPRRAGADPIGKALIVLDEILEHGLLLTPERIVFREWLQDGSQGKEGWLFQKRICFTELHPSDVRAHGETFGCLALEWDIRSLRQLGAIPVFYVPLNSNSDTLEGLGASLLTRLGEAQEVLQRLDRLRRTIDSAKDPNELIQIIVSDRPAAQTVCSVKAAVELLGYLAHEVQPFENLTASICALSGFFYPTENLKYTDELGLWGAK